MTEVIRNSLINEKPKPKLLHRFKFIQRYFSYSTLQQKHLDKSSKSISTQSNSIKVKPINDDPFHLHNMTSPKLLNSRRNTNHWTMKQFKKRIQATHNNHKHKQKSATLSVEPTRDQMTSQMHHHHLYTTQYHTLKDTTSVVYTNGKDNFDTLDEIHLNNSRTMDDVSLQSISMSSLSLDDYNNDNDKADIQITNLDEVELHHRINDEKITPSNFVNEILKESGLDKSWFTVDHKMDDDDDGDDHQQRQQRRRQQEEQEQQHQERQRRQQQQVEDEDRRQARKESLNDSTTPLNGQLSMSDIYSIFTSHEQLDHYNKSFIEMNNNTSSISSNLLNVNKHKAKSNMITSLLKSNLYSKGIQLKQYLNIPTKCKTLPTMETHLSSSEKRNSSGGFHGHQSLCRNPNRSKSYFNQEHDHNHNNNNDNDNNINSFASLISNCNDYPLKDVNSSIKLNQTIHSIPDTLSRIKGQNTDQLLKHSPRRSSSLIRYHRRHDERSSVKINRSHCQHSHPQRQQPYITNYPIEHLIDHDITLPYMPTLFSSDSKSSSLSKESGGKKILNFLQRGFQSKRPKSMVKSERRKITKHRSGSSSNSDHNPPGSSSVISSDKAIVFLGEQIRLPTELYNVFEINPTESSKTNLETTDDVSHLVQICNIDPSLIGSNCNYYFQVMSPSQRMIKASTICLNSSKRKTDDVQCSCLENNGDFSAMNTPNLLRTVSHSQGNVRETVNIPFVIHNYSCQSALERDRWVQFLKRLVNPSQDAQRRKENCLNIWIQEAKGLHMKNRYYCTILVNGTICARTTIKQMTDMLFWGEEFDLSGLTNCSVLTIEIWKVCDTKASSPSHRHLTASPHRLTTSNLRQQTNTSPPMRKVMMTCTKAADDGSVSPPDFTALRNSVILDDLSTTYTNNDEVTSRQKRRKFKSSKMANPSLIATVNISLSDISNCGEVESWYTPNLNDSMTQSSGQLKQSDNKNSGESNVNKTKSKGRRSNRHEINLNSIQIRVKIRYRALIVLPLTSYARLENNLCQFQLPKTITLTNGTDKLNSFKFDSNPSLNTSSKPDLIQLLSSLDPWLNVKAKAELAGAMVVLQQARGQVTGFLASLILCEVKKQSDPNMVLRANSIATKATEIYLRLVGGSYLSNILSDFVQIVISGRPVDPQLKTSNRYPIDYEVDIAKVQTSAQLAQNQVNLLGLVETVWKRILSSEVEFPEQFRALFVEIRRYLENGLKSNYSSMNNIHNKHYDGLNSSNSTMNDGTLCEHVISACLFLRYICPAILSPSLFNLIYEFPSEPRILRAFTLVAKTIQTLANFSLFSGSKETYMKFMNQFVTDQLPAMRQFLQSISVPNPKTTSSYKSLLNNDTVLKPINSLSNIYNNNNSTIHGNSSNNGSMPHSLHIIGSDENCLKSTMSNKVKMKTSSKENNHFINNSQSHHGGFINDIDDYSSHSRQSPVFTSSEITSKLNDIKSSVNGSSMSQKYQSTKSTCNSICLPPLPTNQHGHLGLRDHVDLPLCLALCHLQLSEAIEKVPEDKRMPDVKELKSILDEVNAFLVSGKDPQPNWWHKTTINNNDNNTNHNSNITTISIKDSTPTRKTTAKTISENINNEPKTNSKSLCFQSHRNKPMSNEASIYECTNNESKFIMNTSSSSVHKSINLSDDGGTTISVLNSSITSVISPKQIVCPDIKDSHHDYKEQQVKTTSDSNIKFVISKGRYNNPCIQERVTPRCDSIEIIRIPHSNNHNNSMNTNNEEIYDIMNPTNSHAASLPIDQNVSKKVTESNHDSSTMTQRDNRRRRRVQSARKTQEPIIIHQNIVDTDNNIHVSNTLQKSSGIDHQHLSNHSASIDICSDIMNPEPIEHSEFNPIYLGNSSSSGYFTISSHGNILNYPSIEQESVIVDPIIISTSDNEIITSLSTTSTTDISSMNNPLYTCHSLKQISSINSNDFQKQMTIVDDPNHSLGLCSPQPKKTSQNSVRRHTYVNLSNDVHGTDRLIDALKNNHSNHKVNNIELDKRNWAPPMYISNEQRNRRITLTYPTSYEHVNTPTESINQNVLNYSGSEHLNLTNSFKSSPTEQELCQNSTLQTEIQRIKFIPLNTSYTIGAIPNKRTALFSSENNTPTTVIDLRSELDASQARLAEAQARLLANEAERIQILKSWQSELIKQSQLINASKAVGNNSPIPQFSSNVQLTNTENNLHCNPDENDFDESGPRSISVIPLLNSSALRSQDYSESIYDYDDSELMNNTELTKQYITDTNIQLHTSNGINRNLGLHASSPSSYLKSLRAHTNQPRMGASAVVTNLHDYHGAAPLMSDYLQSTIPRSRIITNRGYQLHNNTTTTITSPTNTELDEFCRISRSPSTPGLSNSNFTRTLPVDPVGGIDNELNSANNSIDPVTNDQEFARQIQAIVHENNQHLYS